MTAIAACLGLRPVANAFGAGSSMTYTPGLGSPPAMHSPSTRLCSRRYSSGSAGRARLTARAILSAFQYEAKAIAAGDDEGDDRADGAVADEVADGGADEHDDEDERADERDAAALVRADQFEHRGEGGRGAAQNSTFGAVRAASSASKYSRCSNFSVRAKITVGNCCSLLL